MKAIICLKRFLLIFTLGVIFSPLASAYQSGKVGNRGGAIYASPAVDATPLAQLKSGESVNLGVNPTNGFYRCTSQQGVSGWISTGAIVFLKRSGTSANRPGLLTAAGADEIISPFAHPYSVGGLVGVGILGGSSAFSFGALADYRFKPDLALGIFVSYGTLGGAGVSNPTYSLLTLAPELNYYFDKNLTGFWIGAKAGVSFSIVNLSPAQAAAAQAAAAASGSTTQVSGTSLGLVFGASAGYDYPVEKNITVGGQGDFLVFPTAFSSTEINFLANLKYWF